LVPFGFIEKRGNKGSPMKIAVNEPIILASSSPRRETLLRSIGISARIIPSDAEESYDPSHSPSNIVCALAMRKAHSVAQMQMAVHGAGIIIGADTIVVLAGQVLGKPKSRAHAIEMLSLLQGKKHEVYTGVAIVDARTGITRSDYSKTIVRMKPCSQDKVERYVDTGEPMDKAGAYAIQGLGAMLIDGIEGCYFNVVGLPLSLLSDMLEEFGIQTI